MAYCRWSSGDWYCFPTHGGDSLAAIYVGADERLLDMETIKKLLKTQKWEEYWGMKLTDIYQLEEACKKHLERYENGYWEL